MSYIKILLVDDHPLIRKGLSDLISQEPDMKICGEASTTREVFEFLQTNRPDLIILDISLSEPQMNGLDLIERLNHRSNSIPILVLSMHDEGMYAERAIRAGARGYLMKQESVEKVITAIHKILDGDIYLSEKINQKILWQHLRGDEKNKVSDPDSLSTREQEILRMIGKGLKPREIAGNLGLSVKTIEAHRANIRKKLNLRTASDLVQHAIQLYRADPLSGE